MCFTAINSLLNTGMWNCTVSHGIHTVQQLQTCFSGFLILNMDQMISLWLLWGGETSCKHNIDTLSPHKDKHVCKQLLQET